MKLEFLAHAAFLFTSNKGTKILTDPYEQGGFGGTINYGPIDEQVDVITITHNHADHNYIAPWHQSVPVINQAGKDKFADIEIFGVKVFHDSNMGKERGENIIFVMKIDDIIICHLGDLGHTLNQDVLKTIGKIDVLLLPVGGLYTIDANQATSVMQSLAPKICIPMHYKTEKIAVDFALLQDFLKDKNNVKILNTSQVELNKDLLPPNSEIWVLKYSK
jgi:L-ascorbate metabolism protein UlaG (beta-lactamase superfamily)